jgi:DNA sulfur modification protein DndC
VVSKDTAMENFIINEGEEWLESLLEIRNLLAKTQVPEKKLKYRSHRRRSGLIQYGKNGRIIPGPYEFYFRKELLRKVLMAQKQIREEKEDPSFTLILEDELQLIRHIWIKEEGDWKDHVRIIYSEIYGENNIHWANDDSIKFSMVEQSILAEICKEEDVPLNLVQRLLYAEKETQGMKIRFKIFTNIDKIFKINWAPKKETLEENRQMEAQL